MREIINLMFERYEFDNDISIKIDALNIADAKNIEFSIIYNDEIWANLKLELMKNQSEKISELNRDVMHDIFTKIENHIDHLVNMNIEQHENNKGLRP